MTLFLFQLIEKIFYAIFANIDINYLFIKINLQFKKIIWNENLIKV